MVNFSEISMKTALVLIFLLSSFFLTGTLVLDFVFTNTFKRLMGEEISDQTVKLSHKLTEV